MGIIEAVTSLDVLLPLGILVLFTSYINYLVFTEFDTWVSKVAIFVVDAIFVLGIVALFSPTSGI